MTRDEIFRDAVLFSDLPEIGFDRAGFFEHYSDQLLEEVEAAWSKYDAEAKFLCSPPKEFISSESFGDFDTIFEEETKFCPYFPIFVDEKTIVVESNTYRAVKEFFDRETAVSFVREQNKGDVGFQGWTPCFFTKPVSIPFEPRDTIVE